MATVPVLHALILATLLFGLGLLGVLVRRNLVFVLMSIEIMLNAAALAFIVAGARWGQADGQIMYILVLSLAAAGASIGLAMVLLIYHRFETLDSDAASDMKG